MLSNILAKDANRDWPKSRLITEHSSLITRMYQNTGLNKSMFRSLYLDVLNLYFKENRSTDKELLLNDINAAIRARKGVVLPIDIDAEELHRFRDAWTYAVFLMGLLIHSPSTEKVEPLLKKVIAEWLDNFGVMVHLKKYLLGSDTEEITQIKLLYNISNDLIIETEILEKVETEILEKVETEILEKVETEKEEGASHKDNGMLFYSWLLKNQKSKSDNIFIENGFLYVKSPQIFIEYAKSNKADWKSAQKGFFKLKKHTLNESSKPFHKVNNINCLLINI